jgi:sortase (surface protein transpeptidase)
LDGGPFSGKSEFNLLQDRCDYIVLDDTIDIKNYEVYKTVIDHPNEYTVIINKPEDRNGFMICRRK